jgi:hypothetical protein
MQPGDSLFQRARDELISTYDASGQPYYATTKPYKSTLSFVWTVVSPEPAAGPFTMAYAKLEQGQEIEWFSYGVGDAMAWAPGTINPTKIADESDTNLSKGRRTNGVDDFVIEGISATHKTNRIFYPDQGGPPVVPPTVSTDAEVLDAFRGNLPVVDPGGVLLPAQIGSPFNLEDEVFEAIKPQCAIEFEWDRSKVIKIGTLDEIPEGGAKSFLHASGDPRTDNRYKIPEGYLWRKQGRSDSEFVVRGTIERTLVMPIFLVTPDSGALTKLPAFFYTDISVRLHGLAVAEISQN